ncbi:MAG: group III truncated hemoglobin [Adhaeribacter sp.]
MNHLRHDIASEADIQVLVDAFTEKLQAHPYLSALYEKLSPRDWKQHLFLMERFWHSVLLRSASFRGHPLILHALLPACQIQAAGWVHLFHEVVEERFSGPTAAKARAFAEKMVRIFAYQPAVG